MPQPQCGARQRSLQGSKTWLGLRKSSEHCHLAPGPPLLTFRQHSPLFLAMVPHQAVTRRRRHDEIAARLWGPTKALRCPRQPPLEFGQTNEVRVPTPHPMAPFPQPPFPLDKGNSTTLPQYPTPPPLALWDIRSAASAWTPTEDGDACHFCNSPARVAHGRVFWCVDCWSLVIGWKFSRLQGNRKRSASFHQWYHAFPKQRNWQKLAILATRLEMIRQLNLNKRSSLAQLRGEFTATRDKTPISELEHLWDYEGHLAKCRHDV